MTASDAATPDRELESALAFWRDAGLDVCVEDSPIDRIHVPQPIRRPPVVVSGGQGPGPASAPDIAAAVADARARAAGAETLDALAASIANFEGCPLRRLGAKQPVFARGKPDAQVMLIGEGPGADEDQRGQPFVGKAGQLLDRMLAAIDLKDEVFITNTVFWRPPGNRTPTLEEQMTCAPFVERAIALVKPKMLLLAGGASAKAMLKREEGILSMRGRWFEWLSEDKATELPAMPTLHPAFLLRQPQAKRQAWADILSLAAQLDAPKGSVPQA